jgi:hypothetical protein
MRPRPVRPRRADAAFSTDAFSTDVALSTDAAFAISVVSVVISAFG